MNMLFLKSCKDLKGHYEQDKKVKITEQEEPQVEYNQSKIFE